MKWEEVKIPEVLFFQEGPGVRKWQFKDKGVKLLNGGNINNNILSLNTTKIYLSEEEAYGKYSHFLVEEGDLLIACSGIVPEKFAKKITFAEKDHLPLCMNTSTMRFRPLDDKVDINYFKYVLQSKLFYFQLKRFITGSAQLNFGPSHIEKIKIPLPPLPIQKKIADILDAADAYRQKTKALLDKYDQLTQSIFLDMFGDPVKNEKGWEVKKLENCCTHIIDCPHSTPNYVDYKSEYPCIRTTELDNGRINWTKMKYLDKEGHVLRTRRLVPEYGDIIYGREGSFGDAVMVPKNTQMSLGQRVMMFRVDRELFLPISFWAIMRSEGIYRMALRVTAGSTVGHVNIRDIRNFKIPIPEMSVQLQFAKKIELIERQRNIALNEIYASENLFQSLLQKAFKGELVN